MNEYIEIIHARENNLKNVSLKIPKNKITIFIGVSGSGKSSIVFNTIAQEAGRQLNKTYDSFTRLFLNTVVQRLMRLILFLRRLRSIKRGLVAVRAQR